MMNKKVLYMDWKKMGMTSTLKKKEAQQKMKEWREQDRKVANEHVMNRQFQFVCKVTEDMPEYMKTNLKNMPNNKGYIWKGIQYFGHLSAPVGSNPDQWTLFEKRPGGEMLIHHIHYGQSKKIFRKRPQHPQELIQHIVY